MHVEFQWNQSLHTNKEDKYFITSFQGRRENVSISKWKLRTSYKYGYNHSIYIPGTL